MDPFESQLETPNYPSQNLVYSFADTPYDRNLELHELFHTFHAYISRIRSTLTVETQIVHLNALDETLQWASVGFNPDFETSHPSTLLLLAILQKIYELLRKYVEGEHLRIDAEQIVIPHGQVHVSLEKKAEQLKLTSGEVDRVEQFLHDIQRDVNRATEFASELDKMLISAEIWSDYLAAVIFILSPRTVDEVNESVQMALEKIKSSLEPSHGNGCVPPPLC